MSNVKISIADVRKLKELERGLDMHLNEEEFLIIVAGYNKAIERILREQGEEP